MNWKLLGLVGVIGASGCMDLDLNLDQGVRGSGKLASEHRSVGNFSKIDMRGAYDVSVKVGPATSVDISGDDNLLKLVETTVEDGTLVLSSTKNMHPKKPMKVTITTPDLAAFALKGAGDVDISGVHNDSFTVDLKGAGDLKASGEAAKVDATLKGAGDMDLYNLHAGEVSADLSGAGDMKVYASKYLNAKVSGVGDLSYKGHPAKVDKSKSGVGDINEEN